MLTVRRLLFPLVIIVPAWLLLGGCGETEHDPSHNNIPPIPTTGVGGGSGGNGSGGGLTGETAWSLSAGSDLGTNYAYDVAIDSEGNIIVVGGFGESIDFGGPLEGDAEDGLYIAKLDAAGQYVWAKGFDGGRALSVAVDGSDNIWLFGEHFGYLDLGGGQFPIGDEIYLAKFDPDGNHLVSRSFGSFNVANSNLIAFDVAVMSDGSPVISGKYDGTPDFGGGPLESFGGRDIFLAKFDANGNHVFSYGFGDEQDQLARDIAASGDTIAIAGLMRGSVDFGGGAVDADTDGDIFVAVFDADGTHRWSATYGAAGQQAANSVLVDPVSGDIVVAGGLAGEVDFGGDPVKGGGPPDVFVARFSASGEHQWSRAYGDSYGQSIFGAALDADGNTVITGTLQGAMIVGTQQAHNGSGGVFLAKIGPEGEGLYVDSWENGVASSSNAVATDGLDAVFVGEYKGSIDFGDGEHQSLSPDLFDVFVVRTSFAE